VPDVWQKSLHEVEGVDLQASPAEESIAGLQFQWIFNGRGIAFYAEHTKRPLIDVWFDKTVELIFRS